MAIVRGLNLITPGHYLNKVLLLLLVRQGKIWKLPFVNVIQTSAIDILPIGLPAREPNYECWLQSKGPNKLPGGNVLPQTSVFFPSVKSSVFLGLLGPSHSVVPRLGCTLESRGSFNKY